MQSDCVGCPRSVGVLFRVGDWYYIPEEYPGTDVNNRGGGPLEGTDGRKVFRPRRRNRVSRDW